jgi:hypothetical protein
MPKWLLPWVVPLALVVIVMLVAISIVAAAVALAVVCLVRGWYLKDHPPQAELVKKPFWKF